MRIIAGKAKGHPIYAPKGFKTRPTADRVRESLFNILQQNIFDKHILDLFAGTGALGIEALSRGAKSVDFVDCWFPAIKSIKRNLKLTKLAENASVYHQDSIKFLRKNKKQYDLVFLDPPYNTDLTFKALNLLPKSLVHTGLIIVETNNSVNMPDKFGEFLTYRKSVYGDTAIWFYKFA